MLKIAVGLPSYNESERIAYVVDQVDKGLQSIYPGAQKAIINLDGQSTDNTPQVFLKTRTKTTKKVIQNEGVTGKGNVIRLFWEHLARQGYDAAVVVDADLSSITPQWMQLMFEPICEKEFDLCVPLYTRHKYDGTITNNVVFPIVYGLYCANMRQPIGGDFAFSKKAMDFWLTQDWSQSTGLFGIDNFMTTTAIIKDLAICQVGLGTKKHKPSGPNLDRMFIQVTQTLFENTQRVKDDLKNKKSISNIPTFGLLPGEPQILQVDKAAIKQKAEAELDRYREFYNKPVQLPISSEIWINNLLHYLTNYQKNNRKTGYLESLRALYFGRVFSFIQETEILSNNEAEQYIQKQADLLYQKREAFFND